MYTLFFIYQPYLANYWKGDAFLANRGSFIKGIFLYSKSFFVSSITRVLNIKNIIFYLIKFLIFRELSAAMSGEDKMKEEKS